MLPVASDGAIIGPDDMRLVDPLMCVTCEGKRRACIATDPPFYRPCDRCIVDAYRRRQGGDPIIRDALDKFLAMPEFPNLDEWSRELFTVDEVEVEPPISAGSVFGPAAEATT